METNHKKSVSVLPVINQEGELTGILRMHDLVKLGLNTWSLVYSLGNYQISTSSSFNSSSCLSWSASPNKSNNRKTLTIQPNASLNSSTTY